jgi:hypothetical protein
MIVTDDDPSHRPGITGIMIMIKLVHAYILAYTTLRLMVYTMIYIMV